MLCRIGKRKLKQEEKGEVIKKTLFANAANRSNPGYSHRQVNARRDKRSTSEVSIEQVKDMGKWRPKRTTDIEEIGSPA